MDGLLLLAAGAAVIVGSVLQRTAGMGTGMVLSPIFALLFGAVDGIILTNVASTASAALLALSMRRDLNWPRIRKILVGVPIGAVPAALMVRWTDEGYLQIIIGVLLALTLLVTWRPPRFDLVQFLRSEQLAGALGGFLNTSTGVAAPAMLIHAKLTRWEQREFAASLQPTFFTMGLVSIVTKLGFGSGNLSLSGVWQTLIVVLFAVPVGISLGTRLRRRLSSEMAYIIAIIIVCVGVIGMVARGILAIS